MKIKNLLLYTALITQLALLPVAYAANRKPVHNTPKDTRKVYIKIAADEEYRTSIWKTVTKQDVKAASKAFEKQFGIEFIITEFEKWYSDDNTTRIHKSLDELKEEIKLGKNDIVIGFTGQEYKKYRGKYSFPISGFAEGIGIGNYVLVTCSGDVRTIVHEIGHLWGAVHSLYTESVMCQGSEQVTTKFYGENKKTILRDKYKDFHKKPNKGIRIRDCYPFNGPA